MKTIYIADVAILKNEKSDFPDFFPGLFGFFNILNKSLKFKVALLFINQARGNQILTTLKNEGLTHGSVLHYKDFNPMALSKNDILITTSRRLVELEQGQTIIIDNNAEVVQVENGSGVISPHWHGILPYVISGRRIGKVERNTNETKIEVQVDLDGQGKCAISTGLGFFDHMLEQIAKHGNIGLEIKVDGDLHVDEHHTIEDTAIAFGEALTKAVGNKLGMERYGFALPMDDCSAQVLIDFGGRPWLVWDVDFNREKIGDMPTEMFMHFFKSLSDASKCNLNIKAEGTNEHHKIEGIFKAYARAVKMAIQRNFNQMVLPSTKGML